MSRPVAQRSRAGWLWPLLVGVVTGLYALIPLLGSRSFYIRGDSAAQFAPTWYHLGRMIREGQWPPVLDPSNFAGGNYAAEGLHGVYNPVNVVIYVGASLVPDLTVAITLVKALVLVALALGIYFLGRDYGATRPAAAVMATAIPFSGFTLYWDAGSWPSGLIAFTWTAWVWWAFRRCLRGQSGFLLPVLIGGLAVTQGNPYGTIGVVVVGVAVILEGLATDNRAGSLRVVGVGVGVALFLPLVYIPLMRVSALASRANLPFIENTGLLRPALGDLLGFGAPTYLPGIKAIRGAMTVPAVYLCWFLVPLLPWLAATRLRARWRDLTAPVVVAVVFGLLSVGPSQLWLFRWPIRLLEYSWLGVAVLVALALSEGFRIDHWRVRTAGSLGLVAVLGWITVSQHPELRSGFARGFLVLLLLTLALVVLLRAGRAQWVPALAIAGTGLVLLTQTTLYHENESSRPWHVPTDVSQLHQRFGNLHGRVIQFADLRPLQVPGKDAELRRAWRWFLPGSMFEAAGVDAVNSYTGMGFRAFERTLCLHYEGFSKPCGYQAVWRPLKAGRPILADLLKVQTIVVQREYVGYAHPASGWSIVEDGTDRVVYTRDAPLPWPGSRLAFATAAGSVVSAASDGLRSDTVRLRASASPQQLVFALLAWPGYQATLDGHDLSITRNKAGLAVVHVPARMAGELRLSYHTPGELGGVALALLALLGAGAADLEIARRRRTER